MFCAYCSIYHDHHDISSLFFFFILLFTFSFDYANRLGLILGVCSSCGFCFLTFHKGNGLPQPLHYLSILGQNKTRLPTWPKTTPASAEFIQCLKNNNWLEKSIRSNFLFPSSIQIIKRQKCGSAYQTNLVLLLLLVYDKFRLTPFFHYSLPHILFSAIFFFTFSNNNTKHYDSFTTFLRIQSTVIRPSSYLCIEHI